MITVEAKALRVAAGEAAQVAVGGSAPILANVLIEADGSGLRLKATDLDMEVDRHLDVQQGGLEPLKATVPAKLLAGIAAKLPVEAQVTLQLAEGTKLIVAAGRSRFTLATLPPEDFPTFPGEDWDAQFELPAADLARLIDSVAFAICTDETRYYLNGIFFHAVDPPPGSGGEMMLRAAATDGHRLARFQLPLPDGAETLPKAGVIVPRRAIGVIRKLIDHLPKPEGGDATALVGIAVSPRRIRIEAGETVLTSKLIDGQFPDYTRVIPTANDRKLTIDRAALREATERVATIASEKSRAVKSSLDQDRVLLSVTSPENGTALEEVPAMFEGEALEIGFNARYLLDVLGAMGADELVAEFDDPAAPVLLRKFGDDPDGQIYVLMPLRT